MRKETIAVAPRRGKASRLVNGAPGDDELRQALVGAKDRMRAALSLQATIARSRLQQTPSRRASQYNGNGLRKGSASSAACAQ